MNIHECTSKIKTLVRIMDKRDTYAVFIVISVGISSFFLGQISLIESEKKTVTIDRGDWTALPASQTPIPVQTGKGMYVGSKSGTKYHLPTCPGAKMMSETNKIWFSSKTEAEKAGYSPAGNCKGI